MKCSNIVCVIVGRGVFCILHTLNSHHFCKFCDIFSYHLFFSQETSKKGKKEKAQKGKNTLNKFENVQVTTMNAPKFSELPKKPPRTGFLLFSAKFEHKMKGKFSDAKERKESCKDYWNKLPEEHKQIYRNRSRELQEEYKNNLFEFVNNLEEAERVMYLGHYRKQVRAYFCRDIFEEQYPNKVYPVYIASPKKKLRTAVNGMTVKDEAIDSDSDELPVAKKKPKDKNIDIENTESSSSPDSSDQEEEEEEEESSSEIKETRHQPLEKGHEFLDSSDTSSDEDDVATMQRKTMKSPKQRQREVHQSPPKKQTHTTAKGNARLNVKEDDSSEDSSSDVSDIIIPSWKTPTQKPSIQVSGPSFKITS